MWSCKRSGSFGTHEGLVSSQEDTESESESLAEDRVTHGQLT